MSPWDAYLQGGATLLLVVTWTITVRWLLQERARLLDENRELNRASLDLLKKLQDRDAEELRAFREQERRRLEQEARR